MNLRTAISIAALCAVPLAGCGSVTNDIDFRAPAGWTASPSILGRTQIWIKQGTGGAHNSLVILIRGITSTRDVFSSSGVHAGYMSNAQVSKDEHTTICNGQSAEHVVATGTSSSAGGGNTRSAFEAYVSSVHGEKYLAMYIRPQDQSADPQAETAIRSLCPKPV